MDNNIVLEEMATIKMDVEELYWVLEDGPVLICLDPPSPVVIRPGEKENKNQKSDSDIKATYFTFDDIDVDTAKCLHLEERQRGIAEVDEHFRKSYDSLLQEVSEIVINIEDEENGDSGPEGDGFTDISDDTDDIPDREALDEIKKELSRFLTVAEENKQLKASMTSSSDSIAMANANFVHNDDGLGQTDSESADTNNDIMSGTIDSLSDDVFEPESCAKFVPVLPDLPSGSVYHHSRNLTAETDSLSSEIEAIMSSYKTGYLLERGVIEDNDILDDSMRTVKQISCEGNPNNDAVNLQSAITVTNEDTASVPDMCISDQGTNVQTKESWTTSSILSSTSFESGSYYIASGLYEFSEESDVDRHEEFICMGQRPCLRRSKSLNGNAFKKPVSKAGSFRSSDSLCMTGEGQISLVVGVEKGEVHCKAIDDVDGVGAVKENSIAERNEKIVEQETESPQISKDVDFCGTEMTVSVELEPDYTEFVKTCLDIESESVEKSVAQGDDKVNMPQELDDNEANIKSGDKSMDAKEDDFDKYQAEINTNTRYNEFKIIVVDVSEKVDNEKSSLVGANDDTIGQSDFKLDEISDVGSVMDTFTSSWKHDTLCPDTSEETMLEKHGMSFLDISEDDSGAEEENMKDTVLVIEDENNEIKTTQYSPSIEENITDISHGNDVAFVAFDSETITDIKTDFALDTAIVTKDQAVISRCTASLSSEKTEFEKVTAVVYVDSAEVTAEKTVITTENAILSFDKVTVSEVQDCFTEEENDKSKDKSGISGAEPNIHSNTLQHETSDANGFESTETMNDKLESFEDKHAKYEEMISEGNHQSFDTEYELKHTKDTQLKTEMKECDTAVVYTSEMKSFVEVLNTDLNYTTIYVHRNPTEHPVEGIDNGKGRESENITIDLVENGESGDVSTSLESITKTEKDANKMEHNIKYVVDIETSETPDFSKMTGLVEETAAVLKHAMFTEDSEHEKEDILHIVENEKKSEKIEDSIDTDFEQIESKSDEINFQENITYSTDLLLTSKVIETSVSLQEEKQAGNRITRSLEADHPDTNEYYSYVKKDVDKAETLAQENIPFSYQETAKDSTIVEQEHFTRDSRDCLQLNSEKVFTTRDIEQETHERLDPIQEAVQEDDELGKATVDSHEEEIVKEDLFEEVQVRVADSDVDSSQLKMETGPTCKDPLPQTVHFVSPNVFRWCGECDEEHDHSSIAILPTVAEEPEGYEEWSADGAFSEEKTGGIALEKEDSKGNVEGKENVRGMGKQNEDKGLGDYAAVPGISEVPRSEIHDAIVSNIETNDGDLTSNLQLGEQQTVNIQDKEDEASSQIIQLDKEWVAEKENLNTVGFQIYFGSVVEDHPEVFEVATELEDAVTGICKEIECENVRKCITEDSYSLSRTDVIDITKDIDIAKDTDFLIEKTNTEIAEMVSTVDKAELEEVSMDINCFESRVDVLEARGSEHDVCSECINVLKCFDEQMLSVDSMTSGGFSYDPEHSEGKYQTTKADFVESVGYGHIDSGICTTGKEHTIEVFEFDKSIDDSLGNIVSCVQINSPLMKVEEIGNSEDIFGNEEIIDIEIVDVNFNENTECTKINRDVELVNCAVLNAVPAMVNSSETRLNDEMIDLEIAHVSAVCEETSDPVEFKDTVVVKTSVSRVASLEIKECHGYASEHFTSGEEVDIEITESVTIAAIEEGEKFVSSTDLIRSQVIVQYLMQGVNELEHLAKDLSKEGESLVEIIKEGFDNDGLELRAKISGTTQEELIPEKDLKSQEELKASLSICDKVLEENNRLQAQKSLDEGINDTSSCIESDADSDSEQILDYLIAQSPAESQEQKSDVIELSEQGRVAEAITDQCEMETGRHVDNDVDTANECKDKKRYFKDPETFKLPQILANLGNYQLYNDSDKATENENVTIAHDASSNSDSDQILEQITAPGTCVKFSDDHVFKLEHEHKAIADMADVILTDLNEVLDHNLSGTGSSNGSAEKNEEDCYDFDPICRIAHIASSKTDAVESVPKDLEAQSSCTDIHIVTGYQNLISGSETVGYSTPYELDDSTLRESIKQQIVDKCSVLDTVAGELQSQCLAEELEIEMDTQNTDRTNSENISDRGSPIRGEDRNKHTDRRQSDEESIPSSDDSSDDGFLVVKRMATDRQNTVISNEMSPKGTRQNSVISNEMSPMGVRKRGKLVKSENVDDADTEIIDVTVNTESETTIDIVSDVNQNEISGELKEQQDESCPAADASKGDADIYKEALDSPEHETVDTSETVDAVALNNQACLEEEEPRADEAEPFVKGTLGDAPDIEDPEPESYTSVNSKVESINHDKTSVELYDNANERLVKQSGKAETQSVCKAENFTSSEENINSFSEQSIDESSKLYTADKEKEANNHNLKPQKSSSEGQELEILEDVEMGMNTDKEKKKTHRRNRSISHTFMSKLTSEISKRPEYNGKVRKNHELQSDNDNFQDNEANTYERDICTFEDKGNVSKTKANTGTSPVCGENMLEMHIKERKDTASQDVDNEQDLYSRSTFYPGDHSTGIVDNVDYMGDTDTSSTLEDVRERLEEWLDSQSDDSMTSLRRKSKRKVGKTNMEQNYSRKDGRSEGWKEQQLYAYGSVSSSDSAGPTRQRRHRRIDCREPASETGNSTKERRRNESYYDFEHHSVKKQIVDVAKRDEKAEVTYGDRDASVLKISRYNQQPNNKEDTSYEIAMEKTVDEKEKRRHRSTENSFDSDISRDYHRRGKENIPMREKQRESLAEKAKERQCNERQGDQIRHHSEKQTPFEDRHQQRSYYESSELDREKQKMNEKQIQSARRIAAERNLRDSSLQRSFNSSFEYDIYPETREKVLKRYDSGERKSPDTYYSSSETSKNADPRERRKPSKYDYVDLPRRSPEEKFYSSRSKQRTRGILTEPHIRKFGDGNANQRQRRASVAKGDRNSGSFEKAYNERLPDYHDNGNIIFRDNYTSRMGDYHEMSSRREIKESKFVPKGGHSGRSRAHEEHEHKYKDSGQFRTYETHKLIIKERESNRNLISFEAKNRLSASGVISLTVDQCKSVQKSDNVTSTQKSRDLITDRQSDQAVTSVNTGKAPKTRNGNQYLESGVSGKNDILSGNRVRTPICNQSNGKAFYQDDPYRVAALHSYENLKDNRSLGRGNDRKVGRYRNMRIPASQGNTVKGEDV